MPTASQLVAAALALLPHPPPKPHAATDAHCWLCGGTIDAPGWPRTVFPATFTNVNVAAAPSSRTVCQACVAVSSGETWAAYAARRPDLGLVTKHPISWRSYSHLVTATEHHCPRGPHWRRWLLDPPDPPFVAVVAVSGQKHLLFRASVATSQWIYPVQIEEERVVVNRERFAACLAAFEALYRLGLSKEGIATGRYHHGALVKIGPRAFHAAEAAFAPWRRDEPGLTRLAAICAAREETES